MRRALGLRRGVVADVDAGDVVSLVSVGLDSSVIDNVCGVLSFLLFPLVDAFGNNKQCIIVVQITAPSAFGFSSFTNSFRSGSPSFGWSSCSHSTQFVMLSVNIFHQLLACFLS